MESVSANFEKYISEIQFLRKQVSCEKLAHQNTLKQLQGAYQIIDDIKDALRVEQSSSAKLKSQLVETSGKLQAVSQQYEQQISEIKEMIALKDQELRRINSFLMVNDADVIRLKVINELELTHREEVEKIHLELSRKQAEMNELHSNYALACSKNEHLQKQAKNQQEEHKDSIEQLNAKYISQLKETYQLLQRERSEHSKWAKKHELLESRSHRQTEFYKAEIAKLNQELHNESKSLLSNNQAKTNKHRLEKYEEELVKLKEELANERHSNSKMEEEIARLRKEIKGFRKIEQDWAIEKDRFLQQIEGLKRDILARESQSKKALQSLRKQLQEKFENSSSNVREGREKLQRLELDYKRATFRIQELQIENQSLKDQSLDKNIAALKRDLSDKSEEITELKDEIRALRKKEGEKKRATSNYERDEQGQLKGKLQEANDKIVELLKEKIVLKREIGQLRARQ